MQFIGKIALVCEQRPGRVLAGHGAGVGIILPSPRRGGHQGYSKGESGLVQQFIGTPRLQDAPKKAERGGVLPFLRLQRPGDEGDHLLGRNPSGPAP